MSADLETASHPPPNTFFPASRFPVNSHAGMHQPLNPSAQRELPLERGRDGGREAWRDVSPLNASRERMIRHLIAVFLSLLTRH